MIIEVLISAMHQSDMSIFEKCNICTSCLVINQCDIDDYNEMKSDYGRLRMISTRERGLSRSRNAALENSAADICVICDDDIRYRDDYEAIIIRAFEELPDADLIVFNIHSLNPDKRPQEKLFIRKKRIPKYKTFGSVHIAFKRNSIVSNNIWFDERFGSGSGLYSMGEDSLFFTQLHKKGLKAYVYPAVIADLSAETSTWFNGYNRKYFYDVGAFLHAAYPNMKQLFKFYYPIRFRNMTTMSTIDILRSIEQGISGYKTNSPYSE